MIPITHFVYLGLGLVVFGIVTAGVRRDVQGLVLHSQHAAWGIALVAAAYARWWGVMEAQVVAAIVVGFAALYGACIAWFSAAALEHRHEHRHGNAQPRLALPTMAAARAAASHGDDGGSGAGRNVTGEQVTSDELEALAALRE